MTFREHVIDFVKKVPKGKVVSYGQVAAAAGNARASRQVGWILRSTDIASEPIPWWRVVNNQGVISIKGNWTATKKMQAELLKKDGVAVRKDFTIEIEKYRHCSK